MSPDFAADHLASLYLTDHRGRLTGINQWDGGTVPRFHLCRSATGNHWRFRSDLDSGLVQSLESLCVAEPVGGDLRADPGLAGACLELLDRAAPVQTVWRGPVYRFPQEQLDPPEADLIALTPDDSHLLARWLPDWLPDVPHRQPFLVAIEDGAAIEAGAAIEHGAAVAVCASVRITPRAHAAGVETHPAFRRRGLAAQVVAAWSKAVRRLGAEPIYSTSWDNVASQGVAANLGLELVAADFHVT